MALLTSSEEAHEFFAPYRNQFLDAVELGIQDCEDCHRHYTDNIIRDAVTHPPTYRTPAIHYHIQMRAEQLFKELPDIKVLYGPHHSLELLFQQQAKIRFQKLNKDFTFSTTNHTRREKSFRNPTGNLFGELPITSVYAGYRLKSSGELLDLHLVGYDHNEGQWFYNVGRGTGEDPMSLPFAQPPVEPTINPDELIRRKTKGA
jgi:hypothetical protein